MPTTSMASADSRQTMNSALPIAFQVSVTYLAMILPFAVDSWNSSTNLYSPAFSALMESEVFAPGATTFSCFKSLLSNSIAVLPSFATSSLKRFPAGTSITAGSSLPSLATILYTTTSCANAGNVQTAAMTSSKRNFMTVPAVQEGTFNIANPTADVNTNRFRSAYFVVPSVSEGSAVNR